MTEHQPEHPDDLDTGRTPAIDTPVDADPADAVDQAETVGLPDDEPVVPSTTDDLPGPPLAAVETPSVGSRAAAGSGPGDRSSPGSGPVNELGPVNESEAATTALLDQSGVESFPASDPPSQ